MATIPTTPANAMPSQYGIKYTRILQRQLQDDSEKFKPFMTTMGNLVGKGVDIPEIGISEMSERTQRHEPLRRKETVFGNRMMRPRSFINTTMFSKDDDLYNNNIDFKLQNINTEVMSALKRTTTQVLLGVSIDTDEDSPTYGYPIKRTFSATPSDVYTGVAGGLLGTNYVGQGGLQLEDLGNTCTGNPLTTNVVDADFTYEGTATSTGLTFDKIRRAIELLKKRFAFIPGVTTCVIAMTSAQKAELERQEAAMNMNYGMGSLANGIQNTILGVTILELEGLPVEIVDGKAVRICPVFIKEAAVWGTWQGASVRIDNDLDDYADTGQVITQAAIGASRKNKGSVIQIMCEEYDLKAITASLDDDDDVVVGS